MASVTIKANLAPLKQLVKRLEAMDENVIKAAQQTLKATMRVAETYAKENLSRKILYPRTGRLRASIGHQVVTEDGAVTARLGILKPTHGLVPIYGAAQEVGAEARPTRAQVMTIPLKAALTAGGVPRFTALQAKKLFDRTFWYNDVLYGVKVEKGRGKRKRTRGEDRVKGMRRDKLIPLFAAATHVKIGGGRGVGRRYLQDARDRVLPDVAPALAERLSNLLSPRKTSNGPSN